MEHVALGGKLDHSKISSWTRLMLWIGSLMNPDPEASNEERHGFDHIDKESIAPIVERIRLLEASEVPVAQ
jgi:hypothetical protein